jgi:ribosomal protein S18 acetylase RimI-like enzyme
MTDNKKRRARGNNESPDTPSETRQARIAEIPPMTRQNVFELRVRQMLDMHYDQTLEIEQLTNFHDELMTAKDLKGLVPQINRIVAVDTLGDVLGFALWFEGPDDTQANIVKLAVHPSTQRRGIGWFLMEYIKRRYSRIELSMSLENQEAMEFLCEQKFAVKLLGKERQFVVLHWKREGQDNG